MKAMGSGKKTAIAGATVPPVVAPAAVLVLLATMLLWAGADARPLLEQHSPSLQYRTDINSRVMWKLTSLPSSSSETSNGSPSSSTVQDVLVGKVLLRKIVPPSGPSNSFFDDDSPPIPTTQGAIGSILPRRIIPPSGPSNGSSDDLPPPPRNAM